jgi:hypothetical protein
VNPGQPGLRSPVRWPAGAVTFTGADRGVGRDGVPLGGGESQPAGCGLDVTVTQQFSVDENFGLIIGQEPPGGSFGPQPGKAASWQLPTGTNLGQ